MPLIRIENGACREHRDTSVFVADDAALPNDGVATVSLARFRDETRALTARGDFGVRLGSDDDPHELESALNQLSLIEVDFPKYTDGRSYSTAQLLRRRLAYAGELRAVGEVLRDQLYLMARSGIDAFIFTATSGDSAAVAQAAIGDFSSAYQPAGDDIRPVYARRHNLLRRSVTEIQGK